MVNVAWLQGNAIKKALSQASGGHDPGNEIRVAASPFLVIGVKVGFPYIGQEVSGQAAAKAVVNNIRLFLPEAVGVPAVGFQR